MRDFTYNTFSTIRSVLTKPSLWLNKWGVDKHQIDNKVNVIQLVALKIHGCFKQCSGARWASPGPAWRWRWTPPAWWSHQSSGQASGTAPLPWSCLPGYPPSRTPRILSCMCELSWVGLRSNYHSVNCCISILWRTVSDLKIIGQLISFSCQKTWGNYLTNLLWLVTNNSKTSLII